MSYTQTTLEQNRIRLTLTIPADTFAQGVEQAYRKMARQITIPGFRRGKAPRAVIEKQYGGPAVFYDEAFDAVFPAAYTQAVRESGIRPVASPEIDITSISLEDGVVCNADVWVYPEVTLGEYKSLPVEKQVPAVSDDDVQHELDHLLESRSRLESVDRPIENGDSVVFDFAGYIDGVAFDGGTAENYTLEIGSGRFIPGFEEQMVGMQKGQQASVNVTFPEDYHAEELKGKPAEFKVTIHDIKQKQLPELNDSFIQDATGCDTLDAYKAETRERLEKAAQERADKQFESDIIEACVKNADFALPPPMIDRGVDSMVQEMQQSLQSSGLQLQDFLQYTGRTLDELRAQYRLPAEQRVSSQLVILAIQEKEDIQVTDEEIDAEIATYAERMGRTAESLKAELSADQRADLAESMKFDKTVKCLTQWSDGKPAKKPAAKKTTTKKAAADTAEGEAKKPAAKKAADAAEGEAKKPAAKKTTTKKAAADTAEGEAKKPAAKKASKPAEEAPAAQE